MLAGFLIWPLTIKRYLTLDLHPGTSVEVEKKVQRPNYSCPGGHLLPSQGEESEGMIPPPHL